MQENITSLNNLANHWQLGGAELGWEGDYKAEDGGNIADFGLGI
jgi:hypothetical protein